MIFSNRYLPAKGIGSYKSIEEVIQARRNGNSLWFICKNLENSPQFLSNLGKNSCQIICELFLSPDSPESIFEELLEFCGDLKIYGFEELPLSLAKVLGKWGELYRGKDHLFGIDRSEDLYLYDLKILSPEVATFIGRSPCETVYFEDLESLSPHVANILAQSQLKEMYFSRLKRVPQNVLKILSTWEGWILGLNGLEEMTKKEIFSLQRKKNSALELNGLTQISRDRASALARLSVWSLHLNGVSYLELGVLKVLVASKKNLELNGLKTLSLKESEVFRNYKNYSLSLDGLEEIGVEPLKNILSSSVQCLSLNGLKELSSSLAELVTQWGGGDIYLNGLKDISTKSAEILSQWKGQEIQLRGLESLSLETEIALSKWRPGGTSVKIFRLDGLKKITWEGLRHFALWPGDTLSLNGLTTILEPNQEKKIPEWKCDSLRLNGLKHFDEEMRNLFFDTNFKNCYLSLGNLSHFDEHMAKLVVQSKCPGLGIEGVHFVSKEALETMASSAQKRFYLAIHSFDSDSPEVFELLRRYRNMRINVNPEFFKKLAFYFHPPAPGQDPQEILEELWDRID